MKPAEKIDAIKSGKPVRIADVVFIAVLAVLIGLLFYFLYRAEPDPEARAVVRYDGRQYGSYKLSEDGIFDIGGKLKLVIENGAAYVADPACPDKICEHSGKIKRVHEMIICAPQGITVRITGQSEIAAGAR